MAYFCNFGQILNLFGKFLWVYLAFGKILKLFGNFFVGLFSGWQFFNDIGQIRIIVNGEILKK